jgi:hypothetical protein
MSTASPIVILTLATKTRHYTVAVSNDENGINIGAACCHHTNGETGDATGEEMAPDVGEAIARMRLEEMPWCAVTVDQLGEWTVDNLFDDSDNLIERVTEAVFAAAHQRNDAYYSVRREIVPDMAINHFAAVEFDRTEREARSAWDEYEADQETIIELSYLDDTDGHRDEDYWG